MSLGILKTSIVVPKAKEFGGIIIYSELFFVTKLSEVNFLGSTMEESYLLIYERRNHCFFERKFSYRFIGKY
jgi:hypothetical protein